MEQRHTVKLTTVTKTSFDLEQEEIKNLYIYLSLFQYRYLRQPDYPIKPLLENLEKDFKKFYLEMLEQSNRDPNNLALSKIRLFFEIHHLKIKETLLMIND